MKCVSFQEFLDQDPSLSDFRDVIEKFDSLIIEIEHLPESVQVGAIVLFTGKKQFSINTVSQHTNPSCLCASSAAILC